MRHSRATLQPLNVPQQGCAAPLGNTLPLFRRRNIRIDPVMNKPGDTFGTAYTLGRRYKPISSHNRAARHSRATLQPQNVPQQFCRHEYAPRLLRHCLHPWETFQAHIVPQQGRATLSGDIKAPKCSLTVLRDTLGRHYKPKTFPNRTALHLRATLRHFFVAGESALIPSRISSETPSAPLGQRYKPTSRPQQNRTAPSGDIIMSRNELLTYKKYFIFIKIIFCSLSFAKKHIFIFLNRMFFCF